MHEEGEETWHLLDFLYLASGLIVLGVKQQLAVWPRHRFTYWHNGICSPVLTITLPTVPRIIIYTALALEGPVPHEPMWSWGWDQQSVYC